MKVVLDTSIKVDAAACGYEEPLTQSDDGLKILAGSYAGSPLVELHRNDVCLELFGEAEIKEVMRALQHAITRSA